MYVEVHLSPDQNRLILLRSQWNDRPVRPAVKAIPCSSPGTSSPLGEGKSRFNWVRFRMANINTDVRSLERWFFGSELGSCAAKRPPMRLLAELLEFCHTWQHADPRRRRPSCYFRRVGRAMRSVTDSPRSISLSPPTSVPHPSVTRAHRGKTSAQTHQCP